MKCMICKTPYHVGEKHCRVCGFEHCKDVVSHSTLDEISSEDRAYYAEVEERYLQLRLARISEENNPDIERVTVSENQWQRQKGDDVFLSEKKGVRKSVNTSAGLIGIIAVITLLVLVGIGLAESCPKNKAPAAEAYVEEVPEERVLPTVTAEPAVSEGTAGTEEAAEEPGTEEVKEASGTGDVTEDPGNTGKQKSDSAAVEIGDVIQFGAYWQDAGTENGKKTIDWLVLDKTDEEMLVISKYALDAKPFHAEKEEVSWETCTLRKWLNEDFLSEAFTGEEIDKIVPVNMDGEGTANSTDSENEKKDRVFLLSLEEMEEYGRTADIGMCIPTEFAISNGASTEDNRSEDGEYACWCWQRSPGALGQFAGTILGISNDGSPAGSGVCIVNAEDVCVRPALRIRLESYVSCYYLNNRHLPEWRLLRFLTIKCINMAHQ